MFIFDNGQNFEGAKHTQIELRMKHEEDSIPAHSNLREWFILKVVLMHCLLGGDLIVNSCSEFSGFQPSFHSISDMEHQVTTSVFVLL